LIYAALVNLLAEDFLSEEAMTVLTKSKRVEAFFWVLLGGEALTNNQQTYDILPD
jgi:solute carrier family 39 (zinc transporter), member 1/2/3